MILTRPKPRILIKSRIMNVKMVINKSMKIVIIMSNIATPPQMTSLKHTSHVMMIKCIIMKVQVVLS